MYARQFKALLVDLDGTLARPLLEVTPRVTEAVTGLARDLPVGIVSSRDHHDVGSLARRLGLGGLHISEGGARIFDPQSGRSAWSVSLAQTDARRILTFLEGRHLALSVIDAGRRFQCSAQVTRWEVTRITAESLTESQARDISVSIGAWPGVHTAVIKRIDNRDWMVDFTHAEASKATAVRRYATLAGIGPSQIIAAGDSYNDLPLLQACGLRIAMGNAASELKAIADYVAPTVDEDGLAVAIEEFVLPRLPSRAGADT